ncbi:hypothetical protein [Chamaesiphon sp. OTE_8_metabat_110]|uniref:hypothetical protein n=1 Tax=Chamaesiphon sp. OTE_8_metabat_110 TaxID=2964696 RepID=UPI00286CCE54|nr:hypothetical protein [Chamaesiphon sp. OTE_8_metabat_110]
MVASPDTSEHFYFITHSNLVVTHHEEQMNGEPDLNELRARYLELINDILPSISIARGFPVHLNHCFGRIVLDNLFQGCWYNYLTVGRVAAYKQLDLAQLQQAVNIAQSLVDLPTAHIVSLNNQSLQWRREYRSS